MSSVYYMEGGTRYVRLPDQADEDEQIGLFWIFSEAVPILEKKLAKLAKRSEKLGLPPLTYEAVRDELVPVHEPGKDYAARIDDPRVGVIKYTVVAIEGEAPQFKGWEFAATIQPIAGSKKALLLTAPDVELPAKVRNRLIEDPYLCDHCKKKRTRNETFAVRNTKTGKYRQVGRSCIKDFTGHKSPQAIANYYKSLAALMADVKEERDPGSYGYIELLEPLEVFFGEVIYEHKESGYYQNLGRVVAGRFWERGGKLYHSEEDIEKGKEVIGIILESLNAKPDNKLNGYEYNVLTALESGYVEPRTSNLIASSIVIYDRIVGRKAREKAGGKPSEWVGEVGQRLSFGTVDCIKTKTIESYYGESQLCIFLDADGNELKWFNSGRTEVESGARYDLTGTVKKHDTFRDKKSTLLTRCKVKPV